MAKTFSAKERNSNIELLCQQEFDLLIIGGGISGAGIARDAASRGMKIALVEANDFAFGTSSRSSKLIHGGIRYLENLEFSLVFEALSERKRLFEMAPHLVHPLRFVLPMYKHSRVSMFKMGLGMWLYDVLSMFEAPDTHERLNAEETGELFPILNKQDLVGAYAYYDAYMDDDRLVIETLRSANELDAVCVNYVQAEGAQLLDGKVKAVECCDQMNGRKFNIGARHIISTVGPWTDLFGKRLFKQWEPILKPSKGIHLTFAKSRLPLKDALVMAADRDERIVFAIPRHEMVIVGTTDSGFEGDPGDVHSNREDVNYLLSVVNEYFPGAEINREDIVASYAGVRPLVNDGTASVGKTSREHIILRDPHNVTFMAGGKYTTYRHMAEEVVESVLDLFPIEDRVRFARGNTLCPLNSRATMELAERLSKQIPFWADATGLSKKDLEFLGERHLSEVEDMFEWIDRLGNRHSGAQTVWALEAVHAIKNTMCLNLVDFYLRRTPLFLSQLDHGFDLIDDLADLFAAELNWSDEERNRQIGQVEEHIRKELAWRA